MRLFYANIKEYDQHAAGQRLLKIAYDAFSGGTAPNVIKDEHGKPYFPERPDIHFSISHSGSFALCAIDCYPVGADIQFIRPVTVSLIRRVCGAKELIYTGFFDLWVLKESHIKLFGELTAPYSEICFTPEAGGYSCKDVKGRVFDGPLGYKIGVCTVEGELPDHAEEVKLS